ncbi:stalk domain-containing protein [Clostridiaceae bacterium M8S5]|nr:stalk domain-containing protein [Clostridiaceae bacterium M8S5]
MKKTRTILMIILTLFIFSTASFAANLNIVIDDEKILFQDNVKPYIDENNRTMIPVAEIAKAFGAEPSWDGKTRTVKLESENNTITLTIDENIIDINGSKKSMDTNAITNNNRTFVPLTFVAKAFGASVSWDGKTNTVTITKARSKFDITVNPKTNYNIINAPSYNIVNTDGQYLYFSNVADGRKLYRCDLKGNNVEKISEIRDVFDINLADNFIIFSYYDYAKKCDNIGRINKENHEFLSYNVTPYRLNVVDNKIYYADNPGDNKEIISLSIDNTNKKQLIEDCDDMLVLDNKIIYTENGDIHILENSESKLLAEGSGSCIIGLHAINDHIYHTYFSSNKISKIDFNGKSESYEMNNEVGEYAIVNNTIFYTDESTGLYEYDIDSKKETKITDGVILFPCVIDNYLFFQNGYDAKFTNVYDLNTEKIIEFK